MSPRFHAVVGWVTAGAVSALMLLSVVTKTYGVENSESLRAMFQHGGIYSIRYYLAVADVLFPILFLMRRTMTLGFLLMVGYWGGATATVLTHGDYGELPVHLAALLMLAICSYFRHPELWARALGRPIGATAP